MATQTKSAASATAAQADVQALMRQFAATYAREMDSVAEHMGLTRTQAVLLGTASTPGSIRDLAARIGCDPSNLTGPIQRLTERELLVVEPDPEDRRVKRIGLSEAGQELLHRLNDGGTRLFASINGASKSELRTLHSLLIRVLDGVGED